MCHFVTQGGMGEGKGHIEAKGTPTPKTRARGCIVGSPSAAVQDSGVFGMWDVKRCIRCHEHPRREHQRWCLECHAAYRREHRPKHAELSPEARARAVCRSYSNTLQKRGTLVPEPCRVCGGRAQKHHPDYGNPRRVEWLCRACHLVLHRAAA